MKDASRCNEKILGRIGRHRTYRCRKCGDKFQTDFRLTPLPELNRVCNICLSDNKKIEVTGIVEDVEGIDNRQSRQAI
jgi:hypothetical protein